MHGVAPNAALEPNIVKVTMTVLPTCTAALDVTMICVPVVLFWLFPISNGFEIACSEPVESSKTSNPRRNARPQRRLALGFRSPIRTPAAASLAALINAPVG